MASNVLGGDLQTCSLNPVTGFYRNGTCDTCADDKGKHTVCAVMTDEFLEFSAQAGNDLSTPVPEYQFQNHFVGICVSFVNGNPLLPAMTSPWEEKKCLLEIFFT